MKLNSSGALQWITQLGASTSVPGGDKSQNDQCLSVAVDLSGNVYCAGSTYGSLGETNAGDYDAIVMKLNSSGALQWITQLGASTTVPGGDKSQSESCFLAIDSSGNVYCAGTTGGAIGEANAGLEDVFLMRIKSDGSISDY